MNILFLGLLVLLSSCTYAQERVILFPNGAPGEVAEYIETNDCSAPEVGGKSVLLKRNVGNPELLLFPAPSSEENKETPMVIVCPGGAYEVLAYDLEGTEICEWLNSLGISAALLKYRVPRRAGRPKHEAPLQDLQRALSYVRFHADELGVDAHKIGVMGFSAGAHLAVMASTHFQTRTYPVADDMDEVSLRPDFCLLMYPAYLSGENFSLAPEIQVTEEVPPTLIVQAEDDFLFINSSLFYYYALKEAKVAACLHLYPHGGHGFGIRKTGNSVNEWPERAAEWFRALRLIPSQDE